MDFLAKKKLLVLAVGGTIACREQDGAWRPSPEAVTALVERFFEEALCRVESPFLVLSESFTGYELRRIGQRCRRAMTEDYDGVVVTCGTDAVAYLAAALSYFLGLCPKPVFLVTSRAPLWAKRQNGVANFAAAVALTGRLRGVLVPWEETEGQGVTLHRGARLLSHLSYCDTVFSYRGVLGTLFSDGRWEPCEIEEPQDAQAPFSPEALSDRCEKILCLSSAVGMRYPTVPRGVRYLFLTGYHSDTLDTASAAARRFWKQMRRRGITPFLACSADALPYESKLAFSELGICPVTGLSPVAAYLKLWLLSAEETLSQEALLRRLQTPLGGDLVL